jgi:YD repeat-containing protein
VDLDYDASGRIVEGRESSGRRVKYQYDAAGRLARVTTSDGIVRRYTYGDRDEMLTIDEPTWSIANTFEDGRVVAQITRMPDEEPYSIRFKYTVADGRVTMNDVTENDGTHTVYRFNDAGYVLSETIDAESESPISVTYDRSASTNVAMAMTIRCRTTDGHVVRTVSTQTGFGDDEIKRTVIARECGVR